jgi:S1-C subfamily serine protease
MNTAIYSPSGASAGIGFAIPVDTLKSIVETIIREGKVVRPLIGITYLESSQARALGKEEGRERNTENRSISSSSLLLPSMT